MRQYCRANVRTFRIIIPTLLAALLVLSACGGGGADQGEEATGTQATESPRGGGREVPTMPAAQFAQPTTMIDLTKVAEIATTPEPEQVVDVEFGGQVYARNCAQCHGKSLEGITDKAKPITSYDLDEAALVDLLRTGGGFGPEHILGLDKVSPDGITALHAYLQTLPVSE